MATNTNINEIQSIDNAELDAVAGAGLGGLIAKGCKAALKIPGVRTGVKSFLTGVGSVCAGYVSNIAYNRRWHG